MTWSSTSVFLFVLVLPVNYARGLLVNHEVRHTLTEPLWISKKTDNGFICHPSSMSREQTYMRGTVMRSVPQGSSSNDDLQLVHERQIKVRNGYLAIGIAYLMVCVRKLYIHFTHYGRSVRSIYHVLDGSFLITCVLFLLAQATAADITRIATESQEFSLKSNTFKRLNWIVIVNSLLSLTVPVIDPQFTNPIFLLPAFAALWNAFKGHLYGGVIGWIPTRHVCAIFTDMHDGWFSTMATIKRFKWKSWAYMIVGGIIGSMAVVKFQQALFLIGWMLAGNTNYSSVALASHVSRFARLMVVCGLILTLKDATDRNVLRQAPNWQISALVALDLASLTGYLWSPGVKRLSFSYALGGASLFFAMITGYNAIPGCARAKN